MSSFLLPPSLPLSCPLSFLPSFFSHVCYYFKYTELHCSQFSLLALLLFPSLFFFSPYFFLHSLSHPSFSPHLFFLPRSASSPSSCEVKWSHSVVSNSASLGFLCPCLCFSGNSTGVDCHCFLQRIFPTQGSNLGLLHCRQTLYHLSHKGSLVTNMEWKINKLKEHSPKGLM